MKVVHIWVKDEVFMQIVGLEPAETTFLYNKYAIEVEGSYFMPARRIGGWDGKMPFYQKTGITYLQFLEEIVPYLEKWNYHIELHDERLPFTPIIGRMHKDWFLERTNGKIELRPYQVEAINLAVEYQSGVLVMATASGKTLTVAALCDLIAQEDHRALIIVPSSDLVDQTAETFDLVNLDYGKYSGSHKDLDHQHVIATWQSLQNNPGLISQSTSNRKPFSAVLVDEAHGAKAAVIGKMLSESGKNIPIRLGFTGTLPKPETDKATIKGVLGPQLFSITAAELIQMGYLAKLEIEPIEIVEKADEEFPDYTSEKAYVAKQPDRLDFMANLIIDRANRFGNTLVLVNNIKQGQQLQKLIKDSVFLSGSTDNDTRAEHYNMFDQHDNLIVIATTGIASVGISIDRIFCLFFLDAGKGFIKAIQGIGRGIRKGRDKDFVHVCDVFSGLKYGKKHWKERAKHYREASYPVLKVVKVKL